MDCLRVHLEAYREGLNNPLRVVRIKKNVDTTGIHHICIQDVSASYVGETGFDSLAYDIEFSLPLDFTPDHPVFGALEAYGLAGRELITAMWKASEMREPEDA